MNKFKTAAIEILSLSKHALHYKEITKLALEKGILETDGATPESSMNSQIITDIIKKGTASDFIKTAPATFAINLNKKQITAKKQIKLLAEEKQEDEKIIIESGFVGKGGEFLVCSELLFRGYNASIMSVDYGIDIIATKNNKLFGIQVKTSNLNQYNNYVFDVRKISFERDHSGNVYYVFVLKSEERNNFLILPRVEMEKKVFEKAILEINNGKTYRVNISIRDDAIYLGNRNHEMRFYKNNWSIIK
jgi:hypothetical protein